MTAPDAVDAEVGRAWVSDDREQLNRGGMLAVGARGVQLTDEPGWDDKRRVSGYEMEAGTTYTVFVELTLPSGSSIRDLAVTVLLDGAEVEVPWPTQTTRKPNCS